MHRRKQKPSTAARHPPTALSAPHSVACDCEPIMLSSRCVSLANSLALPASGSCSRCAALASSFSDASSAACRRSLLPSEACLASGAAPSSVLGGSGMGSSSSPCSTSMAHAAAMPLPLSSL